MKEEADFSIKVSRFTLQRRYSWKKEKETTDRDKALFSRKEGIEVLSMLQFLAKHLEFTSRSEVFRAEVVIAHELPGNLRKVEEVKAWLISRLAPESSIIAYVNDRALSHPLSESSEPAESFNVTPGSIDEIEALTEFAKSSTFVRSFGTNDKHFDPAIDYEEEYELGLLYPHQKKHGVQGWTETFYPEDTPDLFGYHDDEEEKRIEVGEELLDMFAEETDQTVGLIIYNNPDKNRATGRVYIVGGFDSVSGRLVGLMLQSVTT